MAFSYSEATGDGVTTTFPFSFVGSGVGYIREEDIHVFLRDSNGEYTEDVNFTLSGTNQVQMAVPPPAPAVGDTYPNIMIRRIVPKDKPYSDFTRGNNFGQSQLNNTALQQLYALHEFIDGFNPEGYFVKSDMNFNGHRITQLGDGVLDDDAATMGQLRVVQANTDAVMAATVQAVQTVQDTAAVAVADIGLIADAAELFIADVKEDAVAVIDLQRIDVLEAASSVNISVANITDQLSISSAQLAETRDLADVVVATSALATSAADELRTALATQDTDYAAQVATLQNSTTAMRNEMVTLNQSAGASATAAAQSAAEAAASALAASVSEGFAMEAEASAASALFDANRAAAYANAAPGADIPTANFGDILTDTVDLEELIITNSHFTNENIPLVRMDLASEDGTTDLGGLL